MLRKAAFVFAMRFAMCQLSQKLHGKLEIPIQSPPTKKNYGNKSGITAILTNIMTCSMNKWIIFNFPSASMAMKSTNSPVN